MKHSLTLAKLRWLALVLMPALAALIGSLGELYQWSFAPRLVATLNIGAVFLGTLLQKRQRGKSD